MILELDFSGSSGPHRGHRMANTHCASTSGLQWEGEGFPECPAFVFHCSPSKCLSEVAGKCVYSPITLDAARDAFCPLRID